MARNNSGRNSTGLLALLGVVGLGYLVLRGRDGGNKQREPQTHEVTVSVEGAQQQLPDDRPTVTDESGSTVTPSGPGDTGVSGGGTTDSGTRTVGMGPSGTTMESDQSSSSENGRDPQVVSGGYIPGASEKSESSEDVDERRQDIVSGGTVI